MQTASTETRGKSMGLIRENQSQGNDSRDWNRALCTPAEGAKFGIPGSKCPLGSSLADRKAQISEGGKKVTLQLWKGMLLKVKTFFTALQHVMKAGFITLIWKQNDGAWNGITALPTKKAKAMPSEHKTTASAFFFF